jgi:hypothetical protein
MQIEKVAVLARGSLGTDVTWLAAQNRVEVGERRSEHGRWCRYARGSDAQATIPSTVRSVPVAGTTRV